MKEVWIIGGGLAGSEAAWQAAERGANVVLYEMRPHTMTPAHQTAGLAELVCSNSFKSELVTAAHGLLKQELRALGGLLVQLAEEVRVPAGTALAVDRVAFSAKVEARLASHPRIRIVREEMTDLPAGRPLLIATGPLTSPALSAALAAKLGTAALFFFDAIAPIVDADSIDRSQVFAGSRYGHGEDYLNCPLDEPAYRALREGLVGAETAELKDFDRERLFEGCLPVEELAARGELTLAFGPLKPVGLQDPRTGRRPFAVVQLRAENQARTMYGLVGFQTRLKYGEQARVFHLIPGLENAEFLRLGAMHRNAFLDAPRVLDPDLSLRSDPHVFVAGQLTGAEGYCEAMATGYVAGMNLARVSAGEPAMTFPEETAIGALTHYLATAPVEPFQPMNFNFGLLPPLPRQRSRADKKAAFANRALAALERFSGSAIATALVVACLGAGFGGCAKRSTEGTPAVVAPPDSTVTPGFVELPPEAAADSTATPATPDITIREEMVEELGGGNRHVKLVIQGAATRASVTSFLHQYIEDHRPGDRELWVSVFLPGMDLQSIEYALAIVRPGQAPQIVVRDSVQTYR
jgi:methylenetetrahydrofolate--tRNA-(uracil-5-)-methyltransferase